MNVKEAVQLVLEQCDGQIEFAEVSERAAKMTGYMKKHGQAYPIGTINGAINYVLRSDYFSGGMLKDKLTESTEKADAMVGFLGRYGIDASSTRRGMGVFIRYDQFDNLMALLRRAMSSRGVAS